MPPAHAAWRDVVDCFSPQSVLPPIPEAIIQIASNNIGGRGGGQIVMLKNGSIRFLDMLTDEELKDVVRPVFPRGTFAPKCDTSSVKPLSVPADEEAAIQKILDRITEKNPDLAHLLKKKLMQVRSLAIETRLDLAALPALGRWKDSSRIDPSLQRPVAMLTGNVLIVQEPLRSQLALEDRAAIFIHEAFRLVVLDFNEERYEASQPLYRLKEIEAATRSLVRTGDLGPAASMLPLSSVTEFIASADRIRDEFERIHKEAAMGAIDLTEVLALYGRYNDFGQRYFSTNKDGDHIMKLAAEMGFNSGRFASALRSAREVDKKIMGDPLKFIPDSKVRGSAKTKLAWWDEKTAQFSVDQLKGALIGMSWASYDLDDHRKGGKFSPQFLEFFEKDPLKVCEYILAKISVLPELRGLVRENDAQK